MKRSLKLSYLLIILFSAFFTIKNVNASNLGVSPNQAYLSDSSTIYKIMSDSNTTCSNYLSSINYDLYSQLGKGNTDYVIDFHYNSNYVSGESFTFSYFENTHAGGSNSDAPYLKMFSDSGNFVRTVVLLPLFWKNVLYTVNCNTGELTSSEQDTKSNWQIYIVEKRNIANEFYPSFYQSSYGEVNYSSNDSELLQNYVFSLDGVYNSELEQVKKMDDFIGSDYYANNFVLGSGVGLIPFYSALSGDFGNVDIPYNGDYVYYFLNNESSLFFTPTSKFDEEGLDTNLYIRPSLLDQTLTEEQLLNIYGQFDIKLGVYPSYESLENQTNYSFYWNNSYNDFFILPDTYLTSKSSMYQIMYYNNMINDSTTLNQLIVYYNPQAWNVTHYTRKSSATSVSIKGVNGTKTYDRNSINTSRMEVLNNSNIQNKPQYGNVNGSNIVGGSGFLSGLLGNIQGIGDFISSVSSGITTLVDGIGALVTTGFTMLGALPTPVSSVLYLCFLLTIVAIILKIFL